MIETVEINTLIIGAGIVGLSIAYEFKEGNDMGGRVDIIRKAFGVMPLGKTIGRVLLDSEYYSNDVMEYLNTT